MAALYKNEWVFFYIENTCAYWIKCIPPYNIIIAKRYSTHRITPTQRFPTQPNPTHLYLWIIKPCNCPLQAFQWYEIQGKGANFFLKIMKNISFCPWVIFYHFAHFSNFPIVAWEKKHKMLVFMEYVCM